MSENKQRWIGIPGEDLGKAFDQRKPWVTKFTIDGMDYGGQFDAMHDDRIDQFFQSFPDAQNILELGSLEGGHTCALAMRPGVRRVIGVEGRPENIERARFIAMVYRVGHVEFVQANLETYDLSSLGRFDAVFCVGLLYHLPNPWVLIRRMSHVSDNLFVWTHHAAEGQATVMANGYRGIAYQEFGLSDPLSGLSASSFWPTLADLKTMLVKEGFHTIRIIDHDLGHPHGPGVTLAASTR